MIEERKKCIDEYSELISNKNDKKKKYIRPMKKI